MPYQSDKQRKFMHARHPEIAARWDAEIRAKKAKAAKKVVKKAAPAKAASTKKSAVTKLQNRT